MSQLIGWPHLTMSLVFWLTVGHQHQKSAQTTAIHPTDPAQTKPKPGRSLSNRSSTPGVAAPVGHIADRPLPPEQEYDREAARHLLADIAAGRLRLTTPDREGAQIRTLARDGCVYWPVPPPGVTIRDARQAAILAEANELPAAISRSWAQRPQLSARSGSESDRQNAPHAKSGVAEINPLRRPPAPALLYMLTVLAGKSTPDRPLELMSLLRPPYRMGNFVHVGPLNPHSLGLAADIASFGGYDIRQNQPESCVKATLALLRELPPGRYRLGLPKAPETPLFVGRPPLPPILAGWLPPATTAKTASAADCVTGALLGVTLGQPQPQPWLFFPPPQPGIEQGRIISSLTTGRPMNSHAPISTPDIVRYQNEGYASNDELQDSRLQRGIAAARKRGVEIVAMFPDGADHVHIDVRQHP